MASSRTQSLDSLEATRRLGAAAGRALVGGGGRLHEALPVRCHVCPRVQQQAAIREVHQGEPAVELAHAAPGELEIVLLARRAGQRRGNERILLHHIKEGKWVAVNHVEDRVRLDLAQVTEMHRVGSAPGRILPDGGILCDTYLTPI